MESAVIAGCNVGASSRELRECEGTAAPESVIPKCSTCKVSYK